MGNDVIGQLDELDHVEGIFTWKRPVLRCGPLLRSFPALLRISR